MQKLLFSEYKLGRITLNNRIVMAPMTRSRAINNIPNEIMVEYYKLRADAGLLLTEGTSPSPNGLGYARIPGLFNDYHVQAWQKVTEAVHAKSGHIFVQLMHTGRVSHPLNLPADAKILAPSPIGLKGEAWTDQKQMQPFPVPQEMSLEDIQNAIDEYAHSAKLAIKAGFDGVELHAANGYLIEQFINPAANHRDDQYGGLAENRIRFALEIAQKVTEAIGGDRVGIRVSPYGVSNDLSIYDDIDNTYSLLAERLSKIGLAYIHVVDHSSMGAPVVSPSVKKVIRERFKGAYILSGGYDAEKAEQDLLENNGDLVAFGKLFISNPNLVEKLKKSIQLKKSDASTYYTPGEKGYTDYPTT
ncbi:MAG TPA: alkene reductase [Ignavibacteriaceae bacterium]|nr:alkene reductase [Ignavibacteriaceae bacterium]